MSSELCWYRPRDFKLSLYVKACCIRMIPFHPVLQLVYYRKESVYRKRKLTRVTGLLFQLAICLQDSDSTHRTQTKQPTSLHSPALNLSHHSLTQPNSLFRPKPLIQLKLLIHFIPTNQFIQFIHFLSTSNYYSHSYALTNS